MYYLQSRYYNSDWGRFINADGIIGETGELLSHNMFAYCQNNVVNSYDPTGFAMVEDVDGGSVNSFWSFLSSVVNLAKEFNRQIVNTNRILALSALITVGSREFENQLASSKFTEANLPGRNGALNQAKRDAGILRNSEPDYVESVAMRQPDYAGGHVIKDANGNVVYTREYHFTNTSGEHVVIQEHSFPHIGSNGPHFNVRPISDTRHGVFPGTMEHYPFK